MSTTTSGSTRPPLAGIPTGTNTNFGTVGTFGQPTATETSGGGNSYNNGGTGGGVNSTLYLFTFLTTLLLLLAVSCGIVIRSFVLRRRFHRRVEEAIAAGVLLPSQTGDIAMGPGGTISVYRRPIGEKPKMWEVWIDEGSSNNHHSSLASEWTKVQPVAVTRLSDTPSNPKFESSADTPAPPPPMTALDHFTSRLPFGLGRRHARTSTAATPASPDAPLPTLAYGASPASGHHNLEDLQSSKTTCPDNNSVQVAVLIAMPDPSKPRYTPGISPIDSHADSEPGGTKGKQRSSELPSASAEEHELPEICIGVTRAQVTPAQAIPSPEPHNSSKPT